MVTPNEFDTGMAIYVDDKLYIIEQYEHSKRGRAGAKIKTKLRDAKSGEIQRKTFKSDDNFSQAILTENPARYLYNDGQFYVFMDMENYDQIQLSPDVVGDTAKFLQENLELELKYCDDEPVGVKLPRHVVLKVESTEPGLKGGRTQSGTKPAETESGLETNVPLFINEGDLIKVDTVTGEYIGKGEKNE